VKEVEGLSLDAGKGEPATCLEMIGKWGAHVFHALALPCNPARRSQPGLEDAIVSHKKHLSQSQSIRSTPPAGLRLLGVQTFNETASVVNVAPEIRQPEVSVKEVANDSGDVHDSPRQVMGGQMNFLVTVDRDGEGRWADACLEMLAGNTVALTDEVLPR
jgi:hypothetical protein